MKQVANSRGFTLAELLIVVAIIAVLVSISIPVFSAQQEKSREGVDLANVRSAYSEVVTMAMMEDEPSANSSIVRTGSAGSYTYTAEVQLKQKKLGWQTSNIASVGNVSPQSDNGIYWLNEPDADGVCTITYVSTAEKATINWGDSFYDYVSPIKLVAIQKNSKSNCLNSTGTQSATIKDVLSKITDEKTNADIKTWAAVRDPSDGSNPNAYNYLISTVDISTVSRGSQVPVILCDKSGNYSVGYATVSKAPDGNYNVITVDANGKYPCTGGSNPYDANFKTSNLLTDKTSCASGAAAQAAYNKLLKQYQGK